MSAYASTDNTSAVRSAPYSNQELGSPSGTCTEQKISTYRKDTRKQKQKLYPPSWGGEKTKRNRKATSTQRK